MGNHCYGYGSMSEMWDAVQKEREEKRYNQEMDNLRSKVQKLEEENVTLRIRNREADCTISQLRCDLRHLMEHGQ